MVNIPDKLYFKIGEVAKLAEVEPYVLRFWQKEFKQLHPQKNARGQRRYSRSDVELVLTIARLRYNEKYSIEGIKKILQQKKKTEVLETKIETHHERITKLVNRLKTEAESILDILTK